MSDVFYKIEIDIKYFSFIYVSVMFVELELFAHKKCITIDNGCCDVVTYTIVCYTIVYILCLIVWHLNCSLIL